MKNLTCRTSNVDALFTDYYKLQNTSMGTERMALVWGESGLGKSSAVQYLSMEVKGIYMTVTPLWTPNVFLRTLAQETNQEPSNRNQDMLDAVQKSLRVNPRPLFFDEADSLFALKNPTRMLETIRALYDMSHAPVVLVGMDLITKKIARWPQLNRRITKVVQFKESSMADARMVADSRCLAHVADDLLERLYAVSGGNMGYIVNGLQSIEDYAEDKGLSEVTLAHWQAGEQKQFFLDRRS